MSAVKRRSGRLRAVAVGLAALLSAATVGVGAARAVAPRGITGDTVRIYNTRELRSEVRTAALAAAADVGARADVFDQGVLGLINTRRNGVMLERARSGFRFPISTVVVPVDAGEALYGSDIGDALAAGDVVMSAAEAQLREPDVEVGDTLSIKGWNGRIRSVRVGSVAGNVPGELLMSPTTAKLFGLRRPAWVTIWDVSDRSALDGALATRGLAVSTVRIERSWVAAPADDVLSTLQTKTMLGEYAIAGTSSIQMDSKWVKANIRTFAFTIGGRTIVKSCHKDIGPKFQEVFDEITQANLASLIDVDDTRRSGGCFSARTIRSVGSSTGRNMSAHSWGMAFDLNTRANCMGCAPPPMDCRIVQIFRAHGFAWGGNFLTTDGMHFEYVGAPRDQLAARPGDYCQTPVTSPPTSLPIQRPIVNDLPQ